MGGLIRNLHKIGDIFHLPDLPKWMCGILFLTLIFRIPSFFEPYYYGDEMIYLTMGEGIRQGVTLYSNLHDNKPPLLYLTAAIAGNLFWFKVILAFWVLATIIIFYKLAARIFPKEEKIQKLATIIFALLTTIPLMEGNIVNAELFMIGPSILAFLILLGEKLTSKKVFWAGVLFGVASLFKIPAMFEVPVIIFYWLITGSEKRQVIKNTLFLIFGFLTPILASIAWYFITGAGMEYVKAAFLQNVGYLSSFRPGDVRKPFLERNFPLLARGGIVLLGLFLLYIKRVKISKKFIFITVWALFTLFAVALSERPYPHYFVQTLGPFCLLLAMFFLEDSIEQVFVVIPLTLSLLVPVYYKFYFYPTASYYSRFVNFASNQITRDTYFDSFSVNTSRNYEIAEFLRVSSKPRDRVFMWDSESAAVYALARRLPPVKYTVPYHVNDFSSNEEVAKQIYADPPKFIILTSSSKFSELDMLIKKKYILIQQIGNASIYIRVNLVKD